MKKTSYQKLKDRNQQLTNDIIKLVKGGFVEKVETQLKWKFILDSEEIIMYGKPAKQCATKDHTVQNVKREK